jgi:hypothetical protein
VDRRPARRVAIIGGVIASAGAIASFALFFDGLEDDEYTYWDAPATLAAVALLFGLVLLAVGLLSMMRR